MPTTGYPLATERSDPLARTTTWANLENVLLRKYKPCFSIYKKEARHDR